MALAAVLATIAAGRLLLGIDTSDESYYVAFLHEWLVHGASNGNSLIVHQTGAFLLFPLAKAFVVLTGSETGIVLFLRAVYLMMAIVAGWAVHYLARRSGVRRAHAALAALFVMTFIPWSLPAPSYNTIGMFGFLVGTFGIVALVLSPNRAQFGLTAVTGLAFGVSAFAYPGFALPVGALVVAMGFVARSWRAVSAVAAVAVATIAVATGLIVATAGGQNLIDVVRFTMAVYARASVTTRIGTSFSHVSSNLGFAVLALGAVSLGIALHLRDTSEQRRMGGLCILLMTGILSADALVPVALFSRSQDVVFLLTCFGVGVIGLAALRNDIGATKPLLRRVLSAAYWTAVLAALVATWSAVMGPFSFHVGGLAAACLVLAFTGLLADAGWRPMALLASVALALNLISAFDFSYGDPLAGPLAVVPSGPYAGLITEPSRIAFLADARQALNAACGTEGNALVIGLPGLYILGQWSQASLFTFGSNPGSSSAEAMIQAFLSAPENAPDCIAVYRSGQIQPFHSESALLARSRRVRRLKAPIPLGGVLDIFVVPKPAEYDSVRSQMRGDTLRAAMPKAHD